MKQETYICPSILAADLSCLGAEINSVEKAGADWIHIDVMDGSFVPPITFGEGTVSAARSVTSLPLDVHLMIKDPDQHIVSFKDAGADRLTVHYEACQHLHRTLSRIKELGIKNGVSINPATPVELIYPVLEISDLVLIMTVNPGWGGQKFIESSLPRIRMLRDEIEKRGHDTVIQVDGGITDATGRLCIQSGANAIVAGTWIFKSSDRISAIKSLRTK